MFRNSPTIYFLSTAPPKVRKYVKWQALQNGSRIFNILGFCSQNFQKPNFFRKTFKNQKFWIFKKKKIRSICYEDQYLLCPCQISRQSVSFWSNTAKITYDKNVAIFRNSRPRTKTKIPPLNLPSKTELDRHQFCLKRPTSKVGPSLPDLTWPRPNVK